MVDLGIILKEIDDLAQRGIPADNLLISDRAQMIMPYHYIIDALQEELKGDKKIGTTKRGIGPAYTDKYARCGLRLADLFNWEVFLNKLHQNVEEKNRFLASYGQPPVNEGEIIELYAYYKERIAPYVADTAYIINKAIDEKRRGAFEGSPRYSFRY